MTISPNPHGPALTLTWQKTGSPHISIDLVPALFTQSIQIDSSVWRRAFFATNTRGRELSEKLRQDEILLVAKKQNEWLVSYEHTAKKMLKGLDSQTTCRKMCHRILKYDVLKWKSEAYSYPGLSTYPLKVMQ